MRAPLLSIGRRRRPAGTHPYSPQAPAGDAFAALRPETGPLPVFRPHPPTAPNPALAGDGGRPARRRVPEAAEVLRQVLDGLRNLPVPAVPQAAPTALDAPREPAPVLPRAQQFTADARKPGSGGLRFFRETGLAGGWAGLEDLRPAGEHVRWSTARWQRQAAAFTERSVEAARAELLRDGDEILAREKRVRQAADVGAILADGAL
jgi:hypothetical protein